MATPSEPTSGAVTVAIRPERIGITTSSGASEAGADASERTELEALLVDSQYIGTDTRYTVRIGDQIELVVRVQNIGERDCAALALGQSVKVYWQVASTTVLDR